MDLAHILEELAYDMGELPREAIEAAIAKSNQIAPFLLEILKDAIERIDVIVEDDNYQGHLYAMYLLAQFRESQAFPLILEIFSFPGDVPHAIAGDVLTEDLSRILASISGKQIEPLKERIENPEINEYVRAACLASFVILVGSGQISRQTAITYFLSLFQEKLERRPSFVWDTLVSSCYALYPEEVLHEIQLCFRDGLVDAAFISLEYIEELLSKEKEQHLFHLFHTTELIDDTVSEMEKWIISSSEIHRNNSDRIRDLYQK